MEPGAGNRPATAPALGSRRGVLVAVIAVGTIITAAFEAAVGAVAASWTTIEGALTALERISAARLVLVVDDLHHLEATRAEAALERLLTYAPGGMALLAASRYPPGFNLPRLRLCGTLIELDPDELRFRAWEVERLFREALTELGRLDADVLKSWAEAGLVLREGRRWPGR